MNTLTNNYKVNLKINVNIIDNTKDDKEVLKFYPQLKLIKSEFEFFKKYGNDYVFCFNYALKDNKIEEVDEAYDRLLDNYKRVSTAEAEKGDIISFHHGYNEPDALNCNHFAIIQRIINGKIIIRSKWGVMGIFEGHIEDLPKSYGNIYQIWRYDNENTIL